mmetsp:Transcript_25157/g.60518  ORF Transcript_25157/g.60518 Transcript_25157/m.60518 type:complete len:743 (-) Transcript_25157:74-2302(-)
MANTAGIATTQNQPSKGPRTRGIFNIHLPTAATEKPRNRSDGLNSPKRVQEWIGKGRLRTNTLRRLCRAAEVTTSMEASILASAEMLNYDSEMHSSSKPNGSGHNQDLMRQKIEPDSLAEAWIEASGSDAADPPSSYSDSGMHPANSYQHWGKGFKKLLEADPTRYGKTLYQLERSFCISIRELVRSCHMEMDTIDQKHEKALAQLDGTVSSDGLEPIATENHLRARVRLRVRQSDLDFLHRQRTMLLRSCAVKYSERVSALQRKQLSEFRSFIRVTSSSLEKRGVETIARPKSKVENSMDIFIEENDVVAETEMWIGNNGRRRRFRIRLVSISHPDLLNRFSTGAIKNDSDAKGNSMKSRGAFGDNSEKEVSIYAQFGRRIFDRHLQALLLPASDSIDHCPVSIQDYLLRSYETLATTNSDPNRNRGHEEQIRNSPWMEILKASIESPDCQFQSLQSQLSEFKLNSSRGLGAAVRKIGSTSSCENPCWNLDELATIAVTRHSNLRMAHVVIHSFGSFGEDKNEPRATEKSKKEHKHRNRTAKAKSDIRKAIAAADGLSIGSLLIPLEWASEYETSEHSNGKESERNPSPIGKHGCEPNSRSPLALKNDEVSRVENQAKINTRTENKRVVEAATNSQDHFQIPLGLNLMDEFMYSMPESLIASPRNETENAVEFNDNCHSAKCCWGGLDYTEVMSTVAARLKECPTSMPDASLSTVIFVIGENESIKTQRIAHALNNAFGGR